VPVLCSCTRLRAEQFQLRWGPEGSHEVFRDRRRDYLAMRALALQRHRAQGNSEANFNAAEIVLWPSCRRAFSHQNNCNFFPIKRLPFNN
jgi:hypothetical protein